MARYKPEQQTFFDSFEQGIYKPAPPESKPPPSCGATVTTRTTSDQAAESVKRSSSGVRVQVLEWLRSRGRNGATDEECQVGLSMNPSTQRPRRIELMRAGEIREHGTRPTKSGRAAAVWVCVEFLE